MSKFEVGDRVVVVEDTTGAGYWTGRRGVIEAIRDLSNLPNRVLFDDQGEAAFRPEELELEGVYDALSASPAEQSSSASPLSDDPEVDTSDDIVNHPSHYADGWSNGAEVIDITEHLNFNRGNAVKYLSRAGKKGGPEKELEDLQKALWYVTREVLRLGGTV